MHWDYFIIPTHLEWITGIVLISNILILRNHWDGLEIDAEQKKQHPFPWLPYACLRTHRSKSELGKMVSYHRLARYLRISECVIIILIRLGSSMLQWNKPHISGLIKQRYSSFPHNSWRYFWRLSLAFFLTGDSEIRDAFILQYHHLRVLYFQPLGWEQGCGIFIGYQAGDYSFHFHFSDRRHLGRWPAQGFPS